MKRARSTRQARAAKRARSPALALAAVAFFAGASATACAELISIREVEVKGEGGGPSACFEALAGACPECAGCELVELSDSGTQIIEGRTSGEGRLSPGMCPRPAGGPEKVFAIRAARDGFLTASLPRRLAGAGKKPFDSVLYLLRDCCNADTAQVCADSRSEADALPGGETISLKLRASNELVFLVVDGAGEADAGDFELKLSYSDGGRCDSAIPVDIEPNGAVMIKGSIDGLSTPRRGEETCTKEGATLGVEAEAVYELRARDIGAVAVDMVESSFNAVLYARTRCDAEDPGAQLACVDDVLGGGGESIASLAWPGGAASLWLFVDSQTEPSSKSRTYTLTVTPSPVR